MAIFSHEDAKKLYESMTALSKAQLVTECQETSKTSKELSEELRQKLYSCINSVLDSIENETDEIITNTANSINQEWALELAEKAVNSEENLEQFRKLMLLHFLSMDIDYEAYEYISSVAEEIF